MDPYPLKSKTGPVSLQDTAKKLISGEDPHPVEFDNFWPAGSGTFLSDPDPSCNDGYMK